MELHDVRPGDRVLVAAEGEFFAYCDGWRGTVAGLNNGLVEVKTRNPANGQDGPELTLFVPAGELRLTV